jgi:hypothetical protein
MTRFRVRVKIFRLIGIFVAILFLSQFAAGQQNIDNCPCKYRSLLVGMRTVTTAPILAQAGGENTYNTQPNQPISENQAFHRSLYGTLIPFPTLVLTLPGLIVGPSLGYFYAHMPGRAFTGIGLRSAGLGGVVSSFLICGWDCGPGQDNYNLAWGVFLGSSALVVGSAIYDIATIKRAVRHRNAKMSSAQLTVSPRYFVQSKGVGMQVQIFFR